MSDIVVLDYGSGNLRSAARALAAVGADVTVTSDYDQAMAADGLVVPGVGAFAACMEGFRAVRGPYLVDHRLAGGRPVLGICVGMQIMFDSGAEHGVVTEGVGEWPGVVEELPADILPHMGWNTVDAPQDSVLFEGISGDRFYFVHSYAVQRWDFAAQELFRPPLVTWSEHGAPFIAAVENGPLVATQFHPEKSGDAGLGLLANWLRSIR
ncbi:MAG: imidazole glycerol phosphate synthase subunit HisH [Actinomycetota bacterium]|nr:imidazole glycerol phosphate synthase subunit HisH [Actinomycetota bacterium]